ncbi:MAG: hypothetical protein ACWGMY_01635 [Hyphomicrobiaceae bacterium]
MSDILVLSLITGLVALGSILLSPAARSTGSFFSGHDATGKAPGVFALTFSQVTTWIFARSIMNAAILGYAYGIGGALAYAAYYLSFLTGALPSRLFECAAIPVRPFRGCGNDELQLRCRRPASVRSIC